MEKAIVTGASGLIGHNIIKELLANGIKVLAIGRKERISSDLFLDDISGNLLFCQLDLEKIDELPQKINKMGWSVGESCVFYHFAWAGFKTLTDGTIDDQLKNVSYSANAVKIAKKLGCIKFVNSGSLEETFVEKYLDHNWKIAEYHSNQGSYAVSKLSSRDMCLMVAYLEKIDYIHTRFSAVYDKDFSLKGYISSSLKRIVDGDLVSPPQNEQLFDLIDIIDLSKAYYLIGQNGRNKANYFIGTGEPMTLVDYFMKLEYSLKGLTKVTEDSIKRQNLILEHKDFDILALKKDTGFEINNTFLNTNI
ncbi:NAD(P)-dependent oxidoreductase [Flavobacteriaceae bacterium]|nr:NAD(P)-dependent oxidoreductase [Flavobacteriaceae bacterium]